MAEPLVVVSPSLKSSVSPRVYTPIVVAVVCGRTGLLALQERREVCVFTRN
jgi:hypothetical protein